MAKYHERIKAQELRVAGWSLRAIAEELATSKGSVSRWCRSIILTPEQVQKLKERQIVRGLEGRLKGAEINRQRRLQQIEELRQEGLKLIPSISRQDLLFAGLGLFWGEGEKSNDCTFGFVNSDPKAIIFMIYWLNIVFGIPLDQLRFRIRINDIYRQDIEEIQNFWYKLTGATPEQFGKTVFIKTQNKKVYPNRGSYNGVLTLRVLKSSHLQRKILGLLNALTQAEVADTAA